MREADLWRPSPSSDVITSSLVAVPADPAPFPSQKALSRLLLYRCHGARNTNCFQPLGNEPKRAAEYFPVGHPAVMMP